MAVPRTWNVDWLWSNSERLYPLMDTASATDETDAFRIPNSFLLDMAVSYNAALVTKPGAFYIHTLASYSGGYVLTLAYDGTDFGVVTIPAGSHTWGSEYLIVESSGSGITCGHVSIGNLDEINSQPAGVWTFTAEAGQIQPRCVLPIFSGPKGFRASTNGVLSDLLQGVVVLEAGRNVVLDVDVPENTIYIGAIGDSDFVATCTCAGDRIEGDPIRTINGIGPDVAGNFFLVPGVNCITIDGITNGLIISDTCATPCCGCPELDVINSALQYLRDQYTTLHSFAERLETTSAGLAAVIASSPLDGG